MEQEIAISLSDNCNPKSIIDTSPVVSNESTPMEKEQKITHQLRMKSILTLNKPHNRQIKRRQCIPIPICISYMCMLIFIINHQYFVQYQASHAFQFQSRVNLPHIKIPLYSHQTDYTSKQYGTTERKFICKHRNWNWNIERLSFVQYSQITSQIFFQDSSLDDSAKSQHQNTQYDSIDASQQQEQRLQIHVLPTSPKDMIQVFQSYASNIKRTRKLISQNSSSTSSSSVSKDTKQTFYNTTTSTNHHSSLVSAVRSLIYTLEQQSKAWETVQVSSSGGSNTSASSITTTISFQDAQSLQDAFSQAIVSSIRASADTQNHKLLIRIVQNALQYSSQLYTSCSILNRNSDGDYKDTLVIEDDSLSTVNVSKNINSNEKLQPLTVLERRIFGEAISALTRMKASASKLKYIWNLFHSIVYNHHFSDEDLSTNHQLPLSFATPFKSGSSSSSSLSNSISGGTSNNTDISSAYELNLMIKGLASSGRLRSALDLYKNYTSDSDHMYVGTYDANSTSFGPAIKFQITCDSYTASTLLSILTDSIDENDMTVDPTYVTKINAYSSISPCWQWREAKRILNDFAAMKKLNNHVYTAALKVNERASEVFQFPGKRHFGAKYAMSILEDMKKNRILPDVVTCSSVMSAFDKGKQWKAATALLRSMERTYQSPDTNVSSSAEKSWYLPTPNVYTYASAISSCARCGQYEEAFRILQSMRDKTAFQKHTYNEGINKNNHTNVNPNKWVYNSVLAACAQTKNVFQNQVTNNSTSKYDLAVTILKWMEEDSIEGMDTKPDIVTYNTVLSLLGDTSTHSINEEDDFFTPSFKDVENQEFIINDILDKMEKNNIGKDCISYRNAMLSCRSMPNTTISILQKALSDEHLLLSLPTDWGSMSKGKAYLINVALSVCAGRGDMKLVSSLFKVMQQHDIKSDSITMKNLIKSLVSSGNCEDLMAALNAMKGDVVSNRELVMKYDIDVIGSGIDNLKPIIDDDHYAYSIAGSLKQGNLFLAMKILNAMKLHGLTPRESSLHGIIEAYCKLATDDASEEFQQARAKHVQSKKTFFKIKTNHEVSSTRANAALAMMKSLKEKPVKIQSMVAGACAASGMWYEAREVLWSLHIEALREFNRLDTVQPISPITESALVEVPKLHHSLLKLCARSGNVTAALWYVDAIQDLSLKLNGKKRSPVTSAILKDEDEQDASFHDSSNNYTTLENFKDTSDISHKYSIGMKGEQWKLLLIAASKSAHWRVCFNTLQFIRPFVEATHPRHASSSELETLDRQYESLEHALTAAVFAFETRSQYAWAVRAIDDWIEWSGRRPPYEAVLSACRILAKRGMASQVKDVVDKVLSCPYTTTSMEIRSKYLLTYHNSYEALISAEAITTLYKYGLYDVADEIYANAAAANYLPWAVVDTDMKATNMTSPLVLDLHNMNSAIAHSAVRVSLQHIQGKVRQNSSRGLMIITGKGKRSAHRLRPVLRPEVQRMLTEEFYPPLSSSTMDGNMGALFVSGDDIKKWNEHQQEQKGIRFLAVADVLKSITSGSRLRKALKRNSSTNES